MCLSHHRSVCFSSHLAWNDTMDELPGIGSITPPALSVEGPTQAGFQGSTPATDPLRTLHPFSKHSFGGSRC